jgi:UDP-glucose 4-epimerase
VFAAISTGNRGETFVPKVPSANIVDLAKAIAGRDDVEIRFTGIRPGEKIHEIMVSEEECFRTVERGDYYVIMPVLPELRESVKIEQQALDGEYSSKDDNLSIPELRELLAGSNEEIARFLTVGK